MKKIMKCFTVVLLMYIPFTISASPIYYTFEGTVDSFRTLNFTEEPLPEDYGIDVGLTPVYLAYEIDFEEQGYYTNPDGFYPNPGINEVSGSFYAKLLTPEFIGLPYGVSTSYYGLNADNFGESNDYGSLNGGSIVIVQTSSGDTPNWQVQDWTEGQIFYFAEQTANALTNERIYINAEVTLTSISEINPLTPVPLPASLYLFISAMLGLLGFSVRRR